MLNYSTFTIIIVFVAVLTILKHDTFQRYMLMDPSTSLGLFVSFLIDNHRFFSHYKCMWKIDQVNLQCSTKHAYGPFNKFRIICINFSLTTTQFWNTKNVCKIHNVNYVVVVSFLLFCFNHIRTWYFSLMHAHGPLNKFMIVCINFSSTII